MDIYIGKDGQVSGPYREEEIQVRLNEGILDGSELAWQEGLDDWVNLKEIMKGVRGEATPEEVVEIESADQPNKTALFDLSDPNHKIIESAIREALGKPEGELTQADFDKVTELDLSWQKITSLDIDFLRELKQLTILDLSSNQIGDVAPLKELTQLKELYLEGNPIGDLTPLKELTQLTALGLRGVANCSDMDALMNVLRALPELKWLDIGNNAMINDISPLAELTQLTELRAADNEISDITALQELTQLKGLNLSYNAFSNLTPLAGLKQLSSLSISSNPIEDLSPLKELPNLKYIELPEIEGLDAQIEELQKKFPDCKIL